MVVDLDAFNALRDDRGWNDAETARRMGIDQSRLTKIRDGANPGPRFIHGALSAFQVPYEKLFSLRELVKS